MLATFAVWSVAARAAADPAPPAAAGGPLHAVELEYQELESGVVNAGLTVQPQAVVFQKEPNFGSRRVIRRSLKIGDAAAPALAMAWDVNDGRLYLDLNRNLDLTDDTNGVFTCKSRQAGQTFAGVRIPLDREAKRPPALVDLLLFDYGQAQVLGGTVMVRGFWQGKLSLGGREWQIGLLDNLVGGTKPSHLLLRAWEKREEKFSLSDGSLEAVEWPTRLFFEAHAYDLKWQHHQVGTAARCRLELQERPAELGKLKLTGGHLGRVVLTSKEFTVVLPAPRSEAEVPVGTYERQSTWLEAGNAVAYRSTAGWSSGPSLKVTTQQAAVLTAGGPLTNQVSISRRGRSLVFSYQLVGADGATYRLAREDRSRPPEFAVTQGTKQLAAGKFEYG